MTNATNDRIDDLLARVAELTTGAAIEWLQAHGYRRTDVCEDRLRAAIQKHGADALGPALEEARTAYAANMGRFAVTAFGLAMVNAGFAAAREAVAS